MENSIHHQQRKPNLITWTCPVCQKRMNSRGAPGHLRNRHGKTWRHLYLEYPKLIIEDKNRDITYNPEPLESYFMCSYNSIHNDNAKRTIAMLTRIAPEIKIALVRNDNKTLNTFEHILKQTVQDMMHINECQEGIKNGK